MSAKSVALIPKCVECDAAWLQADEGRWRAYLGGDNLDEPAELVFYSPECLTTASGPVRRAADLPDP